MAQDFNKSLAMDILARYGEGNFEAVADFEYHSAQSFYESSIDHIDERYWKDYRKELSETFKTKVKE